ncbi:sugar ABC transporter ATP-binding protein [Mesorhizobium sp. NZP2298]|uniref:sugar ABC transporter ATP-binding protein n=1 Tax=Mesorhizobium sp. NZP2298 TaxID=2483403 RepID=UPI0015560438|nr:sugar ABC transporter ATP-binding protein [Mesorhizobium sp. NZP2298]QKC98345.1 sugar ABC transporter ATP-binding protein [Mesorhizobium sp. NZP2298]
MQEISVPAIALDGVQKAYGPSVALQDASFSVAGGRVHALLGENGAGKSTTVKILSGLVRPDAGRISVFGQDVSMERPLDAHRYGLQTAFQELTLVPDLTVTENMLIPYQPTGLFGQLKRREAEGQVAAHLAGIGLGQISPRTEIRDLELPLRQKIEIARALFRKPRVLLLDESTSALSGADVAWLAGLVEAQKRLGTTVLFITHRMPEVRLFCDELTILRNGRSVGSYALGDVSDDEVIEMIIGRSIEKTFPVRVPIETDAASVLEVRNLTSGRAKDVSFSIREGEILGVAGLQGMGQLDVFLALFGDRARQSGEILVDGNAVRIGSPQDAVRAKIGINFVPEERKTEALFLKLDGRRNVTMPIINKFTRFGIIDVGAEEGAVLSALDRVQVAERALDTPVNAFSGGNQQKIVMAKWLLAGSRVLLLYDPTRGVDVGTKHEIYLLISDYVRSGGAVLLYSTEIEEVVHLSHRVIVFYAGGVAAEMDGSEDEIREAAIMRAALGSDTGIMTKAAE